MKLKFGLYCFLTLVFVSNLRAEVLFEGYYKVTQFDKHIGFVVQRNEINPKTKEFTTTSFMKLSKEGFDMTESLTAVSSGELTPLKYSHISTDGKKTKTIDATIKKSKLSALIIEDGKTKKIEKKINKDAFLSSALYYMMLKSKTGLQTNTNFDFFAIAEETIDDTKGSAYIDKKLVTVDKLQLLKVTNKFAGSEYENLLTDKGEVYSAFTPATDIKTTLVKNIKEATDGIKIPPGVLVKIFKNEPEGKINCLYTK